MLNNKMIQQISDNTGVSTENVVAVLHEYSIFNDDTIENINCAICDKTVLKVYPHAMMVYHPETGQSVWACPDCGDCNLDR